MSNRAILREIVELSSKLKLPDGRYFKQNEVYIAARKMLNDEPADSQLDKLGTTNHERHLRNQKLREERNIDKLKVANKE